MSEEKKTKIELVTNFDRSQGFNGIPQGKELIVRVTDAEIVTGVIKRNGAARIIDQSHENDEDQDAETINFKLKTRKFFMYRDFPVGDYELIVWYWDKDENRAGGFRDRFNIY